MTRWGLTARLTLGVLGGTALIFAATLTYGYEVSRRLLLQEAQANALNLAASLAHRIEQEFRALAKAPEGLAGVLETVSLERGEVERLLVRIVQDNAEVYGTTAAFEPQALEPGLAAYAPYYYRTSQGIGFADLAEAGYDYFKWDWYTQPRRQGRPVWTEPYFDEGGGGILMCTYAVPFFAPHGEGAERVLKGVVTADLSLDWLADLMASLKAARTGFGFILSANGIFLSHPDKARIMRSSIFTLADQARSLVLRRAGREMIRQGAGLTEIGPAMTPAEAFLAYVPIPSTGWSLGVVWPKAELLAEVNQLSRVTAGLAGAGAVLLALAVFLIARSITGPLRRMVQAAGEVAAGRLDLDLSEVRRGDEVGALAQALERMSADLKRYIHDLTETTAAKQRIESELAIAARIQASILPSTFPPFPDRPEFDLWAVMKPAREVGGDFYDFFFLDPDKLALIIADVSDKGVPAALFMMVSRTLLRTMARQGLSPAEVLAEVNDRLCQGNEAAMFVTVFLAYYEPSSGRLSFASAGHNPPLLRRAQGGLTELKAPGLALGALEGWRGEENSLTLDQGDLLVLYTDGVTEAEDESQAEFGLARLRAVVEAAPPSGGAAELVVAIQAAVAEFTGPRPPFDDLTLTVLKVRATRGPAPGATG